MIITNFTPVSGFLGGALIGSAVILLMAGIGRIAGVSGVLGGALGRATLGDRRWQWLFLGGLVAGGVLARLFGFPGPTGPSPDALAPALVGAVLVGFGTRMGNGCTSGHGICGISRLSTRSLAATATFMAFGFLTVFLVRHMG